MTDHYTVISSTRLHMGPSRNFRRTCSIEEQLVRLCTNFPRKQPRPQESFHRWVDSMFGRWSRATCIFQRFARFSKSPYQYFLPYSILCRECEQHCGGNALPNHSWVEHRPNSFTKSIVQHEASILKKFPKACRIRLSPLCFSVHGRSTVVYECWRRRAVARAKIPPCVGRIQIEVSYCLQFSGCFGALGFLGFFAFSWISYRSQIYRFLIFFNFLILIHFSAFLFFALLQIQNGTFWIRAPCIF